MFSLITSILIIYTITQPLILFSDDLDNLRKEFIHEFLDRDIQEGPFSLSYTLKTSLHSNSVISLFGELSVQDRLPHGWTAYEGRTYFKIADAFEEVKSMIYSQQQSIGTY